MARGGRRQRVQQGKDWRPQQDRARASRDRQMEPWARPAHGALGTAGRWWSPGHGQHTEPWARPAGDGALGTAGRLWSPGHGSWGLPEGLVRAAAPAGPRAPLGTHSGKESAPVRLASLPWAATRRAGFGKGSFSTERSYGWAEEQGKATWPRYSWDTGRFETL